MSTGVIDPESVQFAKERQELDFSLAFASGLIAAGGRPKILMHRKLQNGAGGAGGWEPSDEEHTSARGSPRAFLVES
jgi:hypothetical protein